MLFIVSLCCDCFVMETCFFKIEILEVAGPRCQNFDEKPCNPKKFKSEDNGEEPYCEILFTLVMIFLLHRSSLVKLNIKREVWHGCVERTSTLLKWIKCLTLKGSGYLATGIEFILNTQIYLTCRHP